MFKRLTFFVYLFDEVEENSHVADVSPNFEIRTLPLVVLLDLTDGCIPER